MLPARDRSNRHLAELTADRVSYVVSETAEIDLVAMLHAPGETLAHGLMHMR